MALVVLLRGVNVGGHRRFRPSILARELGDHDVVNIGAAGTFVVRNPGPAEQFRTTLLAKLPFETRVLSFEGSELLRLERDNPFGPPQAGVVRFASFLSNAVAEPPILPLALPRSGKWLVRIVVLADRIALGEYRRDMKTIGYLGQLDRLLGVPVTTRNWNTVRAIVKVLNTNAGTGP